MNGSQNSNEPGLDIFLWLCAATLIVAIVCRLFGIDLTLENFINNVF